jgi:hypothetical protein
MQNIMLGNETQSANEKQSGLSQPRLLLHLEGLALLITVGIIYGQISGDWLLFAVLLFVPDVSMLGYMVNKSVGATVYNLGHFVGLPLALAGIGVMTAQPTLVSIALIWLAHIALDRAAGYGFKYNTAFKDTHMQRA